MAYIKHKRVPAQRRPATMQHKPFVAPVGGWVSGANLAAAPPGTCQVCENFLPTTTGLKMRGGSQKYGRAATALPLESILTYIGGTTRKMFAGANGSVYDLTAPANPNVAPAAAFSGQTSNYYSFANMATVGGNYMTVVNGTDSLRLFDGATWTAITAVSAPAITGVVTSKLSHVNVYANRQWLVEGGTMTVHYLPVDSIAGAVGQLSLAGVFRRGGAVLFTATWSVSSGNGLGDRLVVASTEGEYAVYQGTNPSDAATWSLIGCYDGSPPMGKNACLKVGGDLLILTEIGIVPMSAIQNKDPAALAIAAISRDIQPDWTKDARARRTLPWEIVKWTSHNIAFITCPVTGDVNVTPPWCYAVNLETGKWAKITGWNTRCIGLHNDRVFFGTNDGTLIQTDITGSDDGALIYYTYIGQNEHLAGVGRYTTVQQARAIFRTKNEFNPQLSVATDYIPDLPTAPSAALASSAAGEWDVGLWDQALWDTGSQFYISTTQWVSIGRSGYAHAPQLQITSGSAASPSAELIMFEVTHDPGAIVV